MTLFEMRYGLNIVTDGQRKALANRIVVFDVCAADRSAQIAALRQSFGHPLDIRDTFTAVIAIAHGAILATRNIKHFDELPTPVVNPWDQIRTHRQRPGLQATHRWGKGSQAMGYIKDIPSDNLQASIALLPAFVRLKRTRQNSPGTAL
jgi:hypothetical protein